MAAKCSRIRYALKLLDLPDEVVVTAQAEVGAVRVGAVSAGIRYGNFQVEQAFVSPEYRRCGVATELYTMLAKHGCEHGLALKSDTCLSRPAKGFWRKQERKGRARHVKMTNAYDNHYQLICPITTLRGSRRG